VETVDEYCEAIVFNIKTYSENTFTSSVMNLNSSQSCKMFYRDVLDGCYTEPPWKFLSKCLKKGNIHFAGD